MDPSLIGFYLSNNVKLLHYIPVRNKHSTKINRETKRFRILRDKVKNFESYTNGVIYIMIKVQQRSIRRLMLERAGMEDGS